MLARNQGLFLRRMVGMLIRTGLRVAAIAAASALVLPAARAAAASVVTIEDDSANINTFQALNSTHTHSTNKDGQSFVRFPENLLPPTLKGPEGTADVFAQQASTIVTPSTSPFPTQPVHGIGVSGRARSEAVKAHNGLA